MKIRKWELCLSYHWLKFAFDYNETDGCLVWKIVDIDNEGIPGNSVGSINEDGYVVVILFGYNYIIHRLIYMWHHGFSPENLIDHKNRIRDDNRIENLREITPRGNQQNKTIAKNNSSGFPGVTKQKKKRNKPRGLNNYKATVCLNNKSVFLGCHKTSLDAALARYTWEIQCPQWSCSYKSDLVKAIKKAWPEFRR